MILQRLSVRDFRRFDNHEVTFAPGLNVILGNNEEGKSTLREAITLALFEDPKTTKQRVLGLKRWGANQQFAIELDFEEEGKVYRLTKDFQTKTARLENLGSGEVLRDAKAIGEQVAGMLGLGSRSRFESTVRISQRDITEIKDGQEIAESLGKLITGGGDAISATQVLADLDVALRALRSTSRTNPGPLVALPEQVRSKQRSLTEKQAALSGAQQAKVLLNSDKQALAAAKHELQRKEAIERDCAGRLRLEDDLTKARSEENRLEARVEQARRWKAEINRDEAALRDFTAVLAMSADQVAEMERLAHALDTFRSPPKPQESTAAPSSLGWGRIVLGLALVAIELLGDVSFLPPWVVVISGVALIVWGLLQSQRSSADAAALAELRAKERKAEADTATFRLRELVASAGCASIAEYRAKRREAETLQKRVAETRARLEGLLDGQTVEAAEAERKTVSKTVRDISERLKEFAMRLAKLDQAGYHRLQQEIQHLKRTIESLEESIKNLQVSVGINRVNMDEVNALEEEIQDLSDQLAAAQEREEVLTLVQNTLFEARNLATVSARDLLAGELGDRVREITGGRYTEVEVVPTSLDVRLVSPERGEPVDVKLDGDLSTGTVEQVYLAARLAIARLLAQGRRPPFILDDPFVTFDIPRTEAVMALCRRLSAENQVLLFTCHEGYRSAGDNVIELPRLSGDLC